MRVLALCSYPAEAASTRFRLAQFVEPLRAHDIDLEISPFLSSKQFSRLYTPGNLIAKSTGIAMSLLKRVVELFRFSRYDAILIQREAAILGPAVFETLYRSIGRLPMVLDLDDATYVNYTSPSYGRLANYLKFFGKTEKLIKASDVVICGNRFIAEHAEELGVRTVVIPTVVDTEKFTPIEKSSVVPVIGWIGTHSTFPFLEWLFPTLQRLSEKHSFVLKVVGAGRNDISVPGVDSVSLPWLLDREVEDFQSLDIGLYPMTLSDSANTQWLQGKSGFKAIQYLAVGVPFVMSPVGVASEIGEPGTTHFNAVTLDDWYTYLDKLLSEPQLRARMGNAARIHSLQNYGIERQVDLLAKTLQAVTHRN